MPGTTVNLEETAHDEAPERVLVVEDVAVTRLMLRRTLEADGYHVVEAVDGQQAWDLLRDVVVDAIVTDVQMPKKSGIELLEDLRARKVFVPVILITATPSIEAAVECMRLGAFDYISKPVKTGQLKEKLRAALAASQDGGVPEGHTATEGDVLGDYHVVRTLGEGNMGVVCLVEREAGGSYRQQYALKIVKIGALDSEQGQRLRHRFLHEARAASSITHPNVVRFVEFGLARQEGIPFLVMEYFPHPSLKEVMKSGSPLTLDEKIGVIHQIASALAAIHGEGICHRDVKPGNIMVDRERLIAKLTDFGIARLPESDLTFEASLMGTPAYMAPEAFSTAHIDGGADIFSLGVVAYELLLGVRPFRGDSMQMLCTEIQKRRPTAPRRIDPTLPPALARVLARMLRKRRSQRYATVDELVTDLASVRDEMNQPPTWRRKLKALRGLWSPDWS